jgi:hypothetical protein
VCYQASIKEVKSSGNDGNFGLSRLIMRAYSVGSPELKGVFPVSISVHLIAKL